MLSIEEAKKHIGNELTDQQIQNLLDALYTLADNIIDEYISSCDKM